MSRAEARRWLHGMLHGLPCLPCADAAAPVAQACYPATEPNSYRSLRYHFIVRLTLTSSHLWPQQARQAASGRPHDGLGTRCVHRSLTQIRAASVRDPCRHTGHENEAAWRSVLPPPAATPSCLSPNGHFHPPRWPDLVDPGWCVVVTVLAWPSRPRATVICIRRN